MTSIGRLTDRASFFDLLIACCGTLLLSATYFWLAPQSDSLSKFPVDFSEALYFSVVTFTSLGYGDISPLGYGRIVAAAVVIIGLVFIALLVGKFASERQQSVLLLLHTSDCQRRLSDFTAQVNQLIFDFEVAREKNSITDQQLLLKLMSVKLESISNYLVFNANQARLVEFGNESSLYSLYASLSGLHRFCISIHKTEKIDLLVSRRTLSVANRSLGIVTLMLAFHRQALGNSSYMGALFNFVRAFAKKNSPPEQSQLSVRLVQLHKSMQAEKEILEKWASGAITPVVVEDVLAISPRGPLKDWPTGAHKEVATQLGISNRLAQKCLGQLIQSGRLPR